MSMPSSVTVLAEITLINNLQPADLQQGTSFQITKLPIYIGRIASHNGIANDFVIARSSVSRSHVEISREDNGIWCITNLTIHNEVPNTLLVNGQRVLQQSLHNNDEIGLGSEVKLRFTTTLHENVAEPDSIPTLINADSPFVGGAEGKKVIVNPFSSFEHPVWAAVGTLTGVAGLFGLIEQSQGDGTRGLQLVTGLLALVLCLLILYQAQMKWLSASRQKGLVAISTATDEQIKRHRQRAFSRMFIVNILLLVAFAIITTISYNTDSGGSFSSYAWETTLFLLGILIAFISFLVTIAKLMLKKMLKKGRVLWMSAATFVLAICLFLLAYSINNLGIGYDAAVIGVECILVFVTALVILIIAHMQELGSKGEKGVA